MSRSAARTGSLLVEQLCAAAESRALDLGHRLGEWEDVTEGQALARRARCVRCDQVAYVRFEEGLLGMAGEASSLRCPGGIRGQRDQRAA